MEITFNFALSSQENKSYKVEKYMKYVTHKNRWWIGLELEIVKGTHLHNCIRGHYMLKNVLYEGHQGQAKGHEGK